MNIVECIKRKRRFIRLIYSSSLMFWITKGNTGRSFSRGFPGSTPNLDYIIANFYIVGTSFQVNLMWWQNWYLISFIPMITSRNMYSLNSPNFWSPKFNFKIWTNFPSPPLLPIGTRWSCRSTERMQNIYNVQKGQKTKQKGRVGGSKWITGGLQRKDNFSTSF